MTILMDCEICGVMINTHRPPYCSCCWDEIDYEDNWGEEE